MRHYVGIDPGINGAVAWINSEEPDVVSYEKTPTIPIGKGKKEYSVHGMARLLKTFIIGSFVILEKVHSMPDQGVASSFNFGRGFGLWEGIIASLCIPYELTPPQRWKKETMYGMKREKGSSILKAYQIFPHLNLKKSDHDIADAILMAVYGMRINGATKT